MNILGLAVQTCTVSTYCILPGLFIHFCAREGVSTPGRVEVKLFMIPEEENERMLKSEGTNKGFG